MRIGTLACWIFGHNFIDFNCGNSYKNCMFHEDHMSVSENCVRCGIHINYKTKKLYPPKPEEPV